MYQHIKGWCFRSARPVPILAWVVLKSIEMSLVRHEESLKSLGAIEQVNKH